ncbi:MAG: hypothetical protein RMI94_01140 [Bryobacterales bacterium]|nr:hypothetical protein [Bryobacteraceae bacterium]MDW8129126.1 hypothetical protein [Bryobacterales bacterium]
MDTRAKILGPDGLEAVRRQGRRLKVVTGYFDPLLASHARRLANLRGEGETLVVVVRDLERALLPLGARAELVAALAAVDWVVVAADPEPVIAALAPDELVREETADLERREALIRLVRSRYGVG